MTTHKPSSTEKTRGSTYKVIGTNLPRRGDLEKVTGRTIFGVDADLPGKLYGAVLRSPHAHARIISIDTSQAEMLPGVTAVITAADLPDGKEGMAILGEDMVDLTYQRGNILAKGKVLYWGHAVAAVAATSQQLAWLALSMIKVEYEPLPAVLDIQQAMSADAPLLHAGLRTNDMGQPGASPSNIASHEQFRKGDVEKGFAEAAVIVEREFHTAAVHQGYLEPQNALAFYDIDGQVTIWCSTQGAFGVREQVAEILQIPAGRIRVIPLEVGGGFGGKNRAYLEPLAVLLSQKSGCRPVKMEMSQGEVLAATGPTSASIIRVKVGANKEGLITAATASLAYAAGAFPGSPVDTGTLVTFAPYRIANYQLDSYDVVVNHPWATTYRAPGSTNAVFACETVMDELCEKLGMDPLEFRLINGVKKGDRQVGWRDYRRIGFLETVEQAKKHPHYTAPLGGAHRGRGVACAGWMNGGGTSSAAASIQADGTVTLVVGSVDITGSRTALAMQLAETLGVAAGDVRVTVGDTDTIGYTDGSWGSRTTFCSGWAVHDLGKDLLRQLSEQAARFWEINADQVKVTDGIFTIQDIAYTCKELVAKLGGAMRPVSASVTVRPGGVGMAFGTHIVDVEVNPDTGQVQVLRYTAVQDVGTAVHPRSVEGQIQGGVTQGIGWALTEGYIYDDEGHMLNASHTDYRIPTSMDAPPIEAVLVEVPNPGHPYGVRGAGEMPIVPPPAAIANAIYRAVGVRLSVLPMTSERVYQAIMDKQDGQ